MENTNHPLYTVNGHFLCRGLTGIERFSIEVLKELDKIVPEGFLAILIPNNSPIIPDFKRIKVVKSSKKLTSFWKWTHFTFSGYTKKHGSIGICFANESPVFAPGISFLHDIYCKLYSKDFKTIKEKLRSLYSRFMYRLITRHALHIFTVSNFIREQISRTYKVSPDLITVVPNGWDHFKDIKADESVFESFPQLKPGNYYFTLGSLQKRKNLKWILEYATKHPDDQFAISGMVITGMKSNEINQLKKLANVFLLGYVSDGRVKALMQNCKAFVFPSLYEGFGIPPLEALSVGAKIVISNAASLPEIYRNSAYYIDPYNSNVSLTEILQAQVESPEEILNEYTYKNAAKIFFEELLKIQNAKTGNDHLRK